MNLRVRGGGEKKITGNPWNSTESETGKRETDRSGSEEHSEVEAFKAALDDVLAKATKDEGTDD